MMEPVHRINGEGANPIEGSVVYDWPKLAWNMSMVILAILFAPFTFTVGSFFLFVLLTYFSLLIGHSAGMHRMMIHRSYDCHPAVEKILIYIGVLVGMSGPYGIIKVHDLRDWAQRETACHDFFSHKRNFASDLWWQLTSKFSFKHPPVITIEEKFSSDPFYQWLESSWRFHQVALAGLLYFFGGWDFVVWGVFVRVSVSIVGHWSITYFCHNPGPRKWKVKHAAVQASNIPGLGIITYGECWHNNHHAFPESARIGLEPSQYDPAWIFIKCLAYFGLVSNIRLPRSLDSRDDLEIKVDEVLKQ